MSGIPDPAEAARAECLALVERQDPDRAVALAFAPNHLRGDLAALYAFNIETARVRESVSQPLPGEIRLQWWRDTIAGPDAGTTSGNPIAEALGAVIQRHDLPRDAFDRFIEARIFDLYDDPMPSRAEFEGYAGETASALIILSCLVLDRDAARSASDAAGHAGVAQTVAGALRLLPIHRRQGHVLLPGDILEAAGCTPAQLLGGDAEPARRAIAAVLAYGREHDSAFRAGLRSVAPSLRSAFLPALLARPYFDRIEQQGGEALKSPAVLGPLRRSFTYWRGMRG